MCSCSSLTSRQELLKKSYISGDYKEALSVINSKEFKEKENELLYLLELSSIYHGQKKRLIALENLNKAQILAGKLYTKSIRELILSGFIGDDAKSFYGKIFERSAIFHMQIINMFKLYTGEEYIDVTKEGEVTKTIPKEERRKYLLQARSVVLAWSSFYETLQRETERNFFAFDYHQRLLGALIHEEVGTTNDMNTALILYKNTFSDFDKLISIYPSFNKKSQAAIDEYFSDKKITQIEYSDSAHELLDFIKFKILSITKKRRSYDYKKELKKLNPSKDILAKLNSNEKNITLIYSNDYLDVMKTKIIAYNLYWALNKIEDPSVRKLVEVVGVSTLTYFTLGTLGFSTYSSYSNNGYVYHPFSAGNELIKNIGIEVKIPFVEPSLGTSETKLILESKESKLKLPLSVFNSYQDKLYTSTKQYADRYYNTLGPKIAIKYLVAILAAYKTNQSLKEAKNPFANALTLAQFLISTKAIAATQTVDTRHWVGLSKNSLFKNIAIKTGSYDISTTSAGKETDVGTQLIVSKNGPSLFFL